MKLKRAEIISIIMSSIFILAVIVVIHTRPSPEIEVVSQEICCSSPSSETQESELININTASKEELCVLPGVGEFIADKIIAYRIQYDNFRDISDIIDVSGIGLKTFEKIKDKITV